MLNDFTRARLIQVWLALVGLVVTAGYAVGATVTVGTAALLFVLCLVPPAMTMILWPDEQPQTADETFRGNDRRA